MNLLDLSEPDVRQSGRLYWTILISMIAAYGTYMAIIANTERPSAVPVEYMQSADASFASGSETEALEKADRQPIEINIPKPSEGTAEDTSDPLAKMPDRLLQQDGGGTVSDDLSENAVASKAPAREESPIVVHAMASNSKASPAARAILRRINEAAHQARPPSQDDEEDLERTQLAESTAPPPPLPEQRPYIAREIARHELSSQHGTRLSRPERRTRTIPSNIRAYRADVRTHLAANRPSGGFGSGLVAIAFRLSVDGKIRSAQIKEAPEAEDLHERALTALYRAVPFPAAPGNATSKYRAFTVSFIFE